MSHYIRSPGEDPEDTTYSIDETEVEGIPIGQRVMVRHGADAIVDDRSTALTVVGFFVSHGTVYATFAERSSVTGYADQSAPVGALVTV